MGLHRLLGSQSVQSDNLDQQSLTHGDIKDISHLKISYDGRPVNRCSKTIWLQLIGFTTTQESAQGDQEIRSLIINMLNKASVRRGMIELSLDCLLETNLVDGWTIAKRGDDLPEYQLNDYQE